MSEYVAQHLPAEAAETPVTKLATKQVDEPETEHEMPVRQLNLEEKSKTRRNLFGISGGHVRVLSDRFY